MKSITLNINGEDVAVLAEPRESLADILRERLNLTATHVGCEHGACGACTVEVDGKATRSCLMLGVMAEGRRITTLEGLRDDAVTALLRKNFHQLHGLQCGFCTPGMLVMARDLLSRLDSADVAAMSDAAIEQTVRQGMSGHICRCTGYAGIVRAIVASARALARGEA
jgi:carbon-monoxide dehydrogenase small subunit